jgi:hypothetical protein
MTPVMVLTGMTIGHSSPLAACMVKSATASSWASGRPSTARASSDHAAVIASAKARKPRTA